MSKQGANNPTCYAGGNIDGAAVPPVFLGKPTGLLSVVRTVAGDAAGDYTVTLEPEYAIAPDSHVPTVTPYTFDAVHPFSPAVVKVSSTVLRVRLTSNGVAADTAFGLLLERTQPGTAH